MFAVLWKLRRHRHAEGWLIGVYLILAGIERFIVEFFRAKDDVLSIGITSAQLIAIVALILGGGVLYLRRAPAASVVRA
jgi:phosphatidylglycerol:prolipoprotein diacylglycerol transferase